MPLLPPPPRLPTPGPPARLQIAMDLARALAYLHSKKIVHLDVKSANVLLAR